MTDDITDAAILHVMYAFGGSFVSALSEAWLLADDDNRARLQAAFPEYWAQYRALAILRAQNIAKAEGR